MSTTPLNNAGYYADFRGLDSLKKSAREHDPKALRQVARQFESLMTSMLLKSMRQAKLGDGLGDSQETEFYQDMLDQQVAVQLSQGKGLGLADMLVQQLARRGLGGGVDDSTSTKAPSSTVALGPVTTAPTTAPGPPAGPVPVQRTPARAVPGQSAAPTSCGGIPAPAIGADGPVVESVPAPLSPQAVLFPASRNATRPASLGEQVAFVRGIGPYAERAAARLGIAPEALIAHAALETGWGRHVPSGTGGGSSNNLFGIKAGTSWTGSATTAQTVEYSGAVATSVEQPFRAYGSLEQGINDYVSVLQGSSRFRAALGTGSDTSAFASGLARGGYATDPAYANKLAAVAERVRALRSGAAADTVRMADLGQGPDRINSSDSRLAT